MNICIDEECVLTETAAENLLWLKSVQKLPQEENELLPEDDKEWLSQELLPEKDKELSPQEIKDTAIEQFEKECVDDIAVRKIPSKKKRNVISAMTKAIIN